MAQCPNPVPPRFQIRGMVLSDHCSRELESECNVTCQDIVSGGVTYNTRTPEELTYNIKCIQESFTPPYQGPDSPIHQGSMSQRFWKWDISEESINIGYYGNIMQLNGAL